MSDMLWCLFVINPKVFPWFHPLGMYENKEDALALVEQLPQDVRYDLMHLPINMFLGNMDSDKTGTIQSMLGYYDHEHLGKVEED